MAKTFNDLDDLIIWFLHDMVNFAQTKVVDELKDVYNRHITTDVYMAYEPTSYIRRGQLNGGLGDWKNLRGIVKPKGNGYEIAVVNETPGNKSIRPYIAPPKGTELMQIVETGQGYQVWHNAFPRPATANAMEQISETGLLLDLLKQHYPT